MIYSLPLARCRQEKPLSVIEKKGCLYPAHSLIVAVISQQMGWACHWAHKHSTGSAPWKEIASLSIIIQLDGLLRPPMASGQKRINQSGTNKSRSWNHRVRMPLQYSHSTHFLHSIPVHQHLISTLENCCFALTTSDNGGTVPTTGHDCQSPHRSKFIRNNHLQAI